jgi:hypothetical protein
MLPTKFRQRKEVFILTYFISFLIAVAAGVACHYIIKWLDSDHKGDK